MSETTQLAPQTDEKKSRGLGSYVVWAFVAVMVYLLSSGPAIRYEWNHLGTPRQHTVGYIFSPLYRLFKSSPALATPLGAYWQLWVPKEFVYARHVSRSSYGF
jgi:hypothetical protein